MWHLPASTAISASATASASAMAFGRFPARTSLSLSLPLDAFTCGRCKRAMQLDVYQRVVATKASLQCLATALLACAPNALGTPRVALCCQTLKRLLTALAESKCQSLACGEHK